MKTEADREPSWAEAGGSILQAGLASGFALGIIFVAVWSVAQLPTGPGDLFISLFTTASPATTYALEEGVLYALLSGFALGALVRLGLLGFSFVIARQQARGPGQA